MPASPDLDALESVLAAMERQPPYGDVQQDGPHHHTIGVKGHLLGYAFSGYCEAADVAGMVAAVNAASSMIARCRELEAIVSRIAEVDADSRLGAVKVWDLPGRPGEAEGYTAEYIQGAARRVMGIAEPLPGPVMPCMTIFSCRCCSASTGEWPYDSLPEGWRRIARIDGPNAICPACVADPTALDGLREDGYEDAHVAHPDPAAGEPKL